MTECNRKSAPPESLHHSVYVILLDPAVLSACIDPAFEPKSDPAKPCVYVGMTGLAVEDRLHFVNGSMNLTPTLWL
jgi:hypothetical protein